MSYEEEDTCTTSRVAPVHTLGTPCEHITNTLALGSIHSRVEPES